LATNAEWFSEKVGIIEKPLLVKPTEPEKTEIFLVLSLVWAIVTEKINEKKIVYKSFI
jgi:hypothetical protein